MGRVTDFDTYSAFAQATGFHMVETSGSRITGYADFDESHHTPWGVVHGGVYAAIVETAASYGASLAVQDKGQYAVGVHNATDFLRPMKSGRVDVVAEPIQQGRTQQLWLVTITDAESGKQIARGHVRLQNISF